MTEQKTLTTTFKQKIASGEVKRADMMKVRLEDLHVEEGFNLRTPFEELEGEALQEALDADESLYAHIMGGGQIPPLEVRPRAEGGVLIVEGHRRRRVLIRADKDGAPLRDGKPQPGGDPRGELWVKVEAFVGDDAERTDRILSSQENLKLHAVEIANGYKRLSSFGWTNERIAERRKKTPQHVAQYLLVANADTAVKKAILSGKIAFTEAVKIVRKHGDGAAKFIADKLAGTGKKLTAASIGSKNLPKKIVDEVEQASVRIIDSISEETMKKIVSVLGDPENQGVMVTVPANELADLLKVVNAIKEERTKQAEKRAEAAGIDPNASKEEQEEVEA